MRTISKTAINVQAWSASIMLLVAGCGAEVEPASSSTPIEAQEQELRGNMCRSVADCPLPAGPCRLCSDGSAACPDVDCIKHRCVYSFPQCPPPYDPCARKSCGDLCTACDPNDPSCIETAVVKFCQPDGSCQAQAPSCEPKVFCGGIAGIPCPGAGTCIDDPSDDCDPTLGGADCGGMCVCKTLGSCISGYHWDSSADVCDCVPDAGTSCGPTLCGPGLTCCNASCGICTPPNVACIQIACDFTR